jgi:hypothetical protein
MCLAFLMKMFTSFVIFENQVSHDPRYLGLEVTQALLATQRIFPETGLNMV